MGQEEKETGANGRIIKKTKPGNHRKKIGINKKRETGQGKAHM